MKYRYPCVASKQSTSDKWLVQFAARATEISVWAGIPQKKKFDFEGQTTAETVGFQRQENKARVQSLRDFYKNPENVIQNPLLCSLRDVPESSVRFVPSDSSAADAQLGELIVDVPDFSSFHFEKCVRYVRNYLEDRLPDLQNREPDATLVAELKALASDRGYVASESSDDPDDAALPDDSTSGGTDNGDATSALFEESHIIDFWQDIAALHETVQQLDLSADIPDFLGYTRDALLAYLRPIVLVDGQHRLRGAMSAAREKWTDEAVQAEASDRIATGELAETVEAAILARESRLLPISLLMSDDPEEQVFQFVVVNQKATPIGRALLGTIVSTTLSNAEIDTVATRLKGAGIRVEESQAITYLARHPDSPFLGLVERGLASDTQDVLQWNVFASLISIFRTLKGGKLFGESNDYAEIWRKRFLDKSRIVDNHDAQGFETRWEYWRGLDGPWRDVFIAFWTEVRNVFGTDVLTKDHNHWGRPRKSNLFNKISLTVLAADFFQFLVETRRPMDSLTEIPQIVGEWLENVKPEYFDRDWKLAGTKKDSTGIRNQWASTWTDYRKAGGNLPPVKRYRTTKGS